MGLFGPTQKRDVSYPYRLDLYRSERFGLPRGKAPLIVVHGYSAQMYGMQWLMHAFADLLQDKYAVYQFGFETHRGPLSRNPLSLELASRELRLEIARVVQQHDLDLKGIAFVGHSTGGLIARRAFLDDQKLWQKARFLFYGTPHFGAEVADAKNFLTRRDKQTHELAPGSDFIWRLNRDWAQLPAEAIERVLSVVGTRSDRLLQFGLPRGLWVQADSVVRSTSALLPPLTAGDHFCVHVPLDHSALKEIATHWKVQGSLRKRWQRQLPDPERDLPVIAGLAILKAKTGPLDVNGFWRQCLDYFEAFEKEYHDVQVRELEGCIEYSDGTWMPKGYVRRDDGVWVPANGTATEWRVSSPDEHQRLKSLTQPEMLGALKEFYARYEAFLREHNLGSATIRLDFIDVPPKPTVSEFVCTSPETSSALRELPTAALIRSGERWVTIFIPRLRPGGYRICFRHGSRAFAAEFSIAAHCMSVIELDGSAQFTDTDGVTRVFRSLTKQNDAFYGTVAKGLTDVMSQIAVRNWNVAGDSAEWFVAR